MKTFMLAISILIISVCSYAKESFFADGRVKNPERWVASYSSGNGDGFFEEYIIFLNLENGYRVMRWSVATCTTCASKQTRKPYVSAMPVAYSVKSRAEALKKLNLIVLNKKLIEVGGSPRGENIEFTKEPEFSLEPSFKCAKVTGKRELAICSNPSLILLDLELSFTFEAAKACGEPKDIEKSQNKWWQNYLSKCQSGECVPSAYYARIEILKNICSQ